MIKRILILTIVCAGSLILASCSCRPGTTEPPRKIEVTGSAELEIVPNEIYMTFTLKEYLDAAKKKVKLENIRIEFLKLCKASGIADSNISISSYSGNERWDYYWYSRRKKEPDFMASISYVIKVESADKADKVVSGLDEGAIDNFYISKVSHSEMEKLRRDVKTNALLAARNKAKYLAESIGEELGVALLILEIEDSYPDYMSNESNYSNKTTFESVYTGDDGSSSPDFQKMKLRYEMKVEFGLD